MLLLAGMHYLTLAAFLLPLSVIAQNMVAPPSAYCDPVTGLCTPAPLENGATETVFRDDVEIIYVGDPLCSWCWGISPTLNHLEQAAATNGIPYRIVVGGLRPGGGDAWDEKFQNFLKHHWEEVNERSGQPFGYQLFERESFNYDTEPPCRAVVAARMIDATKERRFFELIQHHFYVQNEDPGTVAFYAPICEELGIDFAQFSTVFESEEAVRTTIREFQQNRQWGVTGYPTVLLRTGQELHLLARGYAEFDQMWSSINLILDQ